MKNNETTPMGNGDTSADELAAMLRADYDAAGRDKDIDRVTAVLLFAEKHMDSLDKFKLRDVVRRSGIPQASYTAWLTAGLRLAKARARLASQP